MALLSQLANPRRTDQQFKFGEDENDGSDTNALLDLVKAAAANSPQPQPQPSAPQPVPAQDDDSDVNTSVPRALFKQQPQPDMASASRNNPMEIPAPAALRTDPNTAGGAPNPNPQPQPNTPAVAAVPKSLSTPTPDMALPDYDSLPGADRVKTLQDRLDSRLNPAPLTMKQRLLRAIPGIAAVGIGGALGGIEGAGGAARGINELNAENRVKQQTGTQDLQGQLLEAEKEQEKQYETGARAKEYGANLENNRLYRETLLGNRTADNKAKNTTNLLKLGLDADGNPLDEKDLPPAMRSKIMLDRSHSDLTQAQQDLVEAKTKGIPAQIQQAQQKVDLATKNYQLRASGQGLAERKFQYQQDKDQNPDIPTAATKTKIQQGSAVVAVGTDLAKQIRDNSDILGPVMGRWTDFQHFVGDQSPEAAALRANMMSYAALHPALHGFRGVSALQHFWDAMGGMKQDPEALAAGVEQLNKSATTMTNAMRGPGAGKGVKSAPPAAPAGVVKWGRDRNGNPVRLSQ